MHVNINCAGVVQSEAVDELFLGPERHEDVRGPGASAKLTFVGNPARVSHIVLGDSYVRRVADLNMLEYDLYTEATNGLVLVHMPGSMGRLAGLVKQVTRRIHTLFTDSFEDPSNKVQIAIVMGYNDPEASLKEYFRHCSMVMMEFKHAFAGVAAGIEVQLGEILFGKSSLHAVYAHRNFVHHQLNKTVGRVTPLRLWAAQLGPELSEAEVKPVNATNIDLRIQRDTLDADKWHHNLAIISATRDVIFDWCRGIVTEEESTPLYTPYRFLRDCEVYLPGAHLGVDQDVFTERDRLYVDHINNPLDEMAAERLDNLPLPAMRLETIQGKVQKRPDAKEERGSVFDRILGPQQQQHPHRGRGAARGAREARGGRVRFQPYGGRGYKGW